MQPFSFLYEKQSKGGEKKVSKHNKVVKKVEPVQSIPAPVSKTPLEFIKTVTRRHQPKVNSTKLLRFTDEIKFINAFTAGFIKGEVEESNIKILADVKAYLRQMPGNPYNLKDHEANAGIHSDMRSLCVHGVVIGDVEVKLQAKQVSTNRVAYWNPVLAQQLIRDAESEDDKKQMIARMKILSDLPNRAGYGLPTSE